MKIIARLSDDTVLADVKLPVVVCTEMPSTLDFVTRLLSGEIIPGDETVKVAYKYRGEHDDGFIYERAS